MTERRRAWLETFADPAVLSDAMAAARSCMTEVDDCDPEACGHPVNRMTPVEFIEWIEDTLRAERRRPQRLDHYENRSAGQRIRRELNLSVIA